MCCVLTLLCLPARLWYAFGSPPNIEITAKPVLGNRVLRYSVMLARISSILRWKLLKALHKQLVSKTLLVCSVDRSMHTGIRLEALAIRWLILRMNRQQESNRFPFRLHLRDAWPLCVAAIALLECFECIGMCLYTPTG